MNIGKYGLWALHQNTLRSPIYTRCKIVAITNGKYTLSPIHLNGEFTIDVEPQNFYTIERKNS